METNNVCNDHLVPIGWGGKLNGCPVCFLEGKIDKQAEQITALKEKNCELAHKIGHLTDDINEQERHTEETQQENQRLKELLCRAIKYADIQREYELVEEIEQALAAQPQKGQENENTD